MSTEPDINTYPVYYSVIDEYMKWLGHSALKLVLFMYVHRHEKYTAFELAAVIGSSFNDTIQGLSELATHRMVDMYALENTWERTYFKLKVDNQKPVLPDISFAEIMGRMDPNRYPSPGENPLDPGYVYIIFDSNTKFYKIGKARSVESRLSQLKTYNIYAELKCKYKTKKYSEDETHLHRKFKSKNIKQEWFNLSEKDLEYISNYFKQI